MRNATKATLSTFGVLAGLAGLEHGVGEILQGNRAPEGPLILSWPDSPFFRVLAGEPAMTILPNLLLSGILSSLVSLILLGWAIRSIHRRSGGPVLLLLSILLLLVGGGFGPPLLGAILAMAAILQGTPFGRSALLPARLRRFLGQQWLWLFTAAVTAWLLLMPGTSLFDTFFGMRNPEAVIPVIAFSAFGLLLLAIFTGFARDSNQVQRAL